MTLRKTAYMEECTVRIPNVCNGMPETTVLAHVWFGDKAKGSKKFEGVTDDMNGFYACSSCHDAVDYRTKVFLSNDATEQLQMMSHRLSFICKALIRTHRRMMQTGAFNGRR